jgi:hypothetical protein
MELKTKVLETISLIDTRPILHTRNRIFYGLYHSKFFFVTCKTAMISDVQTLRQA